MPGDAKGANRMKRIHLLQGGSALLLAGCAGAASNTVNSLVPSSNALLADSCKGGRVLYHNNAVLIEKWTPSGHGGCLDYKAVATGGVKQLRDPDTVRFTMTESGGEEFKLTMNDPGFTQQQLIKFFEQWLRRVGKQQVTVFTAPSQPFMSTEVTASGLLMTATTLCIPTGKTVVKSIKLHKALNPDDDCAAAQLAFAACLIVCIAAWCAAVIDWPLAIAASLFLGAAAMQMQDACPQ
jgi:hypothetical protein